jgi:hypothetical protein
VRSRVIPRRCACDACAGVVGLRGQIAAPYIHEISAPIRFHGGVAEVGYAGVERRLRRLLPCGLRNATASRVACCARRMDREGWLASELMPRIPITNAEWDWQYDFTVDKDAGDPGIGAGGKAPDSKESIASGTGSPGVGVPGGPAAEPSRNSELETAPGGINLLKLAAYFNIGRGMLPEDLRAHSVIPTGTICSPGHLATLWLKTWHHSRNVTNAKTFLNREVGSMKDV